LANEVQALDLEFLRLKHSNVQRGVDKVKRSAWLYMVLGMCLLLVAPMAKANALLPGGTVAPDPANVNGAILATTGWVPFSFAATTGQVEELVVSNSTSPFGPGELAFVYQVQISSGTFEHLTGFDFAGYLTDVGSGCEVGDALLPCAGSTLPTNINRTGDGSTISFNFSPELVGGMWSYALIINANTFLYKTGSIGLIDGGGATVTGYEPTPEPAICSLLGVGLLGLLGLRKKE